MLNASLFKLKQRLLRISGNADHHTVALCSGINLDPLLQREPIDIARELVL